MGGTTDSNDTPEQSARRAIDAKLAEAGWVVQSKSESDLSPLGVARRELATDAGPADYALFVDKKLVGIIEAKPAGTILVGAEAQTREYAKSIPAALNAPIRPLPFLYESSGTETWFTNQLDPAPTARRVFSFHRPETLKQWFDDERARLLSMKNAPVAATLTGRMRNAPTLPTAGMWPAQITAVTNLEESIREGRPRALIQMATGSGKTFTAITAIYRLIRWGGARRVLFLVDRGNLGRQALREFQAYAPPDEGKKFTELYNAINLQSSTIPSATKVVISTIQRLYSVLRGEELDEADDELSAWSGRTGMREPPPVVYNKAIPPEMFDVVVIDECHRSIYTLWRQVLEYFDASLIGLTATPVNHTYAFFNKNVVSEYRHEHAVRDGVNVPFQVYEIRTDITQRGGTIVAEPTSIVKRRDRLTRAERWEAIDEDVSYGANDLDRSVIVPDQIRTVLRTFREKLFTEIFPHRKDIPKTLIFAKSDDHAEDILRILREDWPLSNECAVKVTYKPERAKTADGAANDDGTPTTAPPKKGASHKPEELIQSFRNSYYPRIAVTVDLIATGTDIKPLECVVFMRSVRSRALFEQMKGRGVRVIPHADFRSVTPDASEKTHFVIVDCVGVMNDPKNEPPLERDRSIALGKLVDLVRAGSCDQKVLSTFAARLDHIERRLTDDQRALIESATGGPSLRSLIVRVFDALDGDVEQARAREIFNKDVEALTDEQLAFVQEQLRADAVEPFTGNAKLCEALLTVRKQQDVIIDLQSVDSVTHAGPRADLEADYASDQTLISDFERFCKDNQHSLTALSVLYAKPYGQRLARAELMELLQTIQRPPRQWTSERLWAAYERIQRDRVRGASRGKMLTDLISLVRHAMGVESELVSYGDRARQRFDAWIEQQERGGRAFSSEQREWLELVRDQIVVDFEVQREDLEQTPFAEKGGLVRVWQLFGDGFEDIVNELNRELVA
jgi:type I restriction enzyme R subunit